MLTIDQSRLYREHNLNMLTSQHIREMGIEDAMKRAMEVAADGVDAVYVSVDIDVVDASESPGTGAPEFEGILARDFLRIMDMLSEYEAIGAIDLCEVAPNLDDTGRTVLLARMGMPIPLSSGARLVATPPRLGAVSDGITRIGFGAADCATAVLTAGSAWAVAAGAAGAGC